MSSAHVRERRAWTDQEDQRLRTAVHQIDGDSTHPPSNWNAIAKYVPGRNNKDCRKRWFARMASPVNRGAWSPGEDEKLLEAVAQYGQQWSVVAQLVRTRNSDQCAKRWTDAVNPQIDHSVWRPEEDTVLFEQVEKHGRSWAYIVRTYLPRRTGLAAKNRYNQLTRTNKNRSSPKHLTDDSFLRAQRRASQSQSPTIRKLPTSQGAVHSSWSPAPLSPVPSPVPTHTGSVKAEYDSPQVKSEHTPPTLGHSYMSQEAVPSFTAYEESSSVRPSPRVEEPQQPYHAYASPPAQWPTAQGSISPQPRSEGTQYHYSTISSTSTSTQYASAPTTSTQYASAPTISAQYAVASTTSNQYAVAPTTSTHQYAAAPTTSTQYAVAPIASTQYAVASTTSTQYAVPRRSSTQYAIPPPPITEWQHIASPPTARWQHASSSQSLPHWQNATSPQPTSHWPRSVSSQSASGWQQNGSMHRQPASLSHYAIWTPPPLPSAWHASHQQDEQPHQEEQQQEREQHAQQQQQVQYATTQHTQPHSRSPTSMTDHWFPSQQSNVHTETGH